MLLLAFTGKCSYGYPKPQIEQTYVDENGYTQYRRRDAEQDAWAVPHIPALLVKYQCHFNVEHVFGALVIDYLYMYFFKLPPSVRLTLKEIHKKKDYSDEIKNYIKCRYVGSVEAAWRILGYPETMATPSVQVLKVHLPEQVSLRSKTHVACSQLQRYFFRPSGAHFEDLTYGEYFLKYSVYPNPLKTKDRPFFKDLCPPSHGKQYWVYKRDETKTKTIARLPMMTPKAGEKYYLRMLLANFPARSFADLKQVEGTTYPTFQEAATKCGLLSTENEMKLAMKEAFKSGSTAYSLRNLFVTFTTDGHPTIELLKTPKYREMLWSDCDPKNRYNDLLNKLSDRFDQLGYSLEQFELPIPESPENEITKQLATFDPQQQKTKLKQILEEAFSSEQRDIYGKITHTLRRSLEHPDESYVMYIDGKSGRGKTHLLKTIALFIRAQGKIALTCGTTGKAALHLEGGRTAHNLFKIPVKPTGLPEEQMGWEQPCDISINSPRAELIRESMAILWDEWPSANKRDVQKVNDLCKNITGKHNLLFGGIPMIFAGDFEQIPPVVPGGNKHAVIKACVQKLPFWEQIKIYTLHEPQRDRLDQDHSQMVDNLGMGTYPHAVSRDAKKSKSNEPNPYLVTIPFKKNYNADTEEDKFCEKVFPTTILEDPQAASERAIITCLNRRVDMLNAKLLSIKKGKKYQKFSTDDLIDDSIKLKTSHSHVAPSFKSIAFLHETTAPGVPPHKLELKHGSLCFTTRNLSYDEGILNNAVVEIVYIGTYIIKVRSLSLEKQTGQRAPVVDIPRIHFEFYRGRSGIKIVRKQFPLRLAYARSIHRVQGDTLDYIGLDLTTAPFAHGQLKVAMGRVSTRKKICALAFRKDIHKRTNKVETNNIVYKELLIKQKSSSKHSIRIKRVPTVLLKK